MRTIFSLILFTVAILVSGCDPVPSRQLTSEEKAADMAWLFSIFKENYAPLHYKEDLHDFDFETLKEGYLQEAMTTPDNLAFYRLVHRFVAEFKDAHTSPRFTSSYLPGREQFATLGFSGYRWGDRFVVDYLLPEYRIGGSSMRMGDKITAMNGVPLIELIDTEFTQWKHVGHEEANRSNLMPKLFNRLSLNLPLPEEGEEVILTIEREGVEKSVVAHWRVQDLVTMIQENAKHSAQIDDDTTIAGMSEQAYFSAIDELLSAKKIKELAKEWLDHRFDHSATAFQVIDFTADWRSQVVQQLVLAHNEGADVGRTLLYQNRSVPEHAIFLDCAKTFPAYITWEPYSDPSKGGRFVAYLYLYTFNPPNLGEWVVGELKETMAQLQRNHVTDLVIDCIDNHGGSLYLCLEAAQALAAHPIDYPMAQLRLSDGWLDLFEKRMIDGHGSDRQVAGKIWRQLKKERESGAHLSSAWPIESLFRAYPADRGNSEVMEPFNIVALVNENSVSCADIFPAMLQDNALATIMGSRTMGGGGNVVNHFQSPNSHIIVSQTESLIVRSNGEYIENLGVTPDVELDVNGDLPQKYFNIHRAAINYLLDASEPEEPPPSPPLPDQMWRQARSWPGMS